jgi:hypothetical protein
VFIDRFWLPQLPHPHREIKISEFDVTSQVFLGIIVSFGYDEDCLVVEEHCVPKRKRSSEG